MTIQQVDELYDASSLLSVAKYCELKEYCIGKRRENIVEILLI